MTSYISEVYRTIEQFETRDFRSNNWAHLSKFEFPQINVYYDYPTTAKVVGLFLENTLLYIPQKFPYQITYWGCEIALTSKEEDPTVRMLKLEFLEELKKAVSIYKDHISSPWRECSKEEVLNGNTCWQKSLIEDALIQNPNAVIMSKESGYETATMYSCLDSAKQKIHFDGLVEMSGQVFDDVIEGKEDHIIGPRDLVLAFIEQVSMEMIPNIVPKQLRMDGMQQIYAAPFVRPFAGLVVVYETEMEFMNDAAFSLEANEHLKLGCISETPSYVGKSPNGPEYAYTLDKVIVRGQSSRQPQIVLGTISIHTPLYMRQATLEEVSQFGSLF